MIRMTIVVAGYDLNSYLDDGFVPAQNWLPIITGTVTLKDHIFDTLLSNCDVLLCRIELFYITR